MMFTGFLSLNNRRVGVHTPVFLNHPVQSSLFVTIVEQSISFPAARLGFLK